MQNLTSVVLSHGAVWAIHAPNGKALWEQLRNTDALVHEREYKASRADTSPYGIGSTDEDGYTIWNGIAIISIAGPMTKSLTSLDNGCSTVDARRQIRNAARNDAITGILLRIYSPGGSVSGTEDLANDVREAVKTKMVWTYFEDLGCSAAYWVGSQADKCFANATAIIGSIGTYMAIADFSGMYELAGVKVHVLSTGPQKGAATEGTEITDDQLAAFQKTVNDLNTHFLSAVATGRSMALKKVQAVATGDVWIGDQAVANGLIDGIASMDQVLQSMVAPQKGRPKQRAQAAAATYTFKMRDGSNATIPVTDPNTFFITHCPACTKQISHDPDAPENGWTCDNCKASGGVFMDIILQRREPEQIIRYEDLGVRASNDFASSSNPPIGTRMEQALDSALIAVEGSLAKVDDASKRVEPIRSLRASQDRHFSSERLKQMDALRINARKMAESLDELYSKCAALGSTDVDATPTESATSPIEGRSERDTTADRLLADAKADVLLSQAK
jgi:signal peptide peptidase SppA